MIREYFENKKRKIMRGYITTREFITYSLNREEYIRDFFVQANMTRTRAMINNSSFLENLGADVAWFEQRVRHPVEMRKWLKELEEFK